MLAARYALPEWAIFAQLCEAGTGGHRYADAVVMNLFRSRGLEVQGFEIKTTRSDWLREKRNPAKADVLARFCDRWWIVAADRKIVAEDELPISWGLLAPAGDSLRAYVQAPKLQAEPLSREFIATVFRRAQADGSFTWQRAVTKACHDAVREAKNRWEKEHIRLVENVEAFEEASGMSIDRPWKGSEGELHELGAAVRHVREGDAKIEQYRRNLEDLRRTARRILESLDDRLGPADFETGEPERGVADG
jgi:hypothetical protein